MVETEKLLQKQYKPIITELRKNPKTEIKTEVKTESEEEFKPKVFSSPKPEISPTAPSIIEEETVFETPDPDIQSIISTPQGQETSSYYIQKKFLNPLTRKYMLKFIKDTGGAKRKIDDTYGPRYEGDTLMLGDKHIVFGDEGYIHINGIAYKGTEGLYELLFKRLPDDALYNDEDLRAYRDILMKTNAHKRHYNPKGNINRNTSLKYKHIIEKLFPKQASGKGLITKNLSAPDISYWDDPNELCDRLRLLVASVEAGNKAHSSEIINIIEELREAGYIKGNGNKTFQSLLK